MKEFIDETAEHQGTAINRQNMLAIQGFIGNKVVGEKTITKKIQFNSDGSITEVIL